MIEAPPHNSIMKVIELCAESGNEIVSYGLAPNPNGFCYERGEGATDEECRKLDDYLDSLSESEEEQLKIELGLGKPRLKLV